MASASRTIPVPTPVSELPEAIDLRLVVTDMDGTLMDGRGRVPGGLVEIAGELRRRGILLCPASGRQLANIRAVLGEVAADGPVIAENGTYVVMGEQELFSSTIPRERVVQVIDCVRRMRANGLDVGAVVAGKHRASVERADAAFLAQVDTYYAARRVVEDLESLPLDDVIKIAVFDFGASETDSAPHLRRVAPDLQVAVSGLHWTDLMPPGASKGTALEAVQSLLGITPAQTAVFGDYLNDLELYPRSELSFAMANAHPRIVAAARYVAPPHTDNGVIRTLEALLERSR